MRLPAEWELQDGIQLTWPHCDTEWFELEKVLGCYVEIAYQILRFERLIIATRDIEECKADISRIAAQKGLEIDLDRISFYETPLNDTWARDHGTIIGDDTDSHVDILARFCTPDTARCIASLCSSLRGIFGRSLHSGASHLQSR